MRGTSKEKFYQELGLDLSTVAEWNKIDKNMPK